MMNSVMMIFSAAAMLFQYNWTGMTPPRDWQSVHFRGPVTVAVQPGETGLEFSAPVSGGSCDSFFHSFVRPPYDQVDVQLALTPRTDGLSLLVALSGGPGCVSPTIKQRIDLGPAGQRREITLHYDITDFPPGNMLLELIFEGNLPSGPLLTLAEVALSQGAPPPLTCRMVPGSGVVFSDAADASVRFDWKLRDPADRLDFTLSGMGVSRRETASGAAGATAFDFSDLPAGDYQLTVSRNGETVQTHAIRRVIPPSSRLVIVDRVPYLQGKPYFAIGLFHVGDRVLDLVNADNRTFGLPEINRSTLFAELQQRHFNAVHYSWLAAPPDYLRETAQYGLSVISEGRGDLDGIQKIKDEPNLLAYYGFDEPKASDYATCGALYAEYKRHDPAHPVVSAFDTRPTGSGDLALVDIAMLDPYPVVGPTSDVGTIIDYADAARHRLFRDDPATCEYAVLQLFTIDGSRFQVEPTAAQVRAEAFAALVAGVKGIFYYAYYTHEPLTRGMSRNLKRQYWFLPESELWDAIGAINADIAAIAPFALEGKSAPEYRLTGIPAFRSWRLGDQVAVIAVNTSGETALSGVFHTPQGEEALTLQPYEVRIWRFTILP